MPRIRDFNPAILDQSADQRLRIAGTTHMGFKGKVWSFTVFLPRLFITANAEEEKICTPLDEELLRNMLVRHFGGCTVNQYPIQGVGRRGEELETNVHHTLTVLTSRWRGTWRYFKALRQELEACSGEEQILILHDTLYIV